MLNIKTELYEEGVSCNMSACTYREDLIYIVVIYVNVDLHILLI